MTGHTLRQFADSRIFQPLGMADTHFHDDHTMIVPNRTSAYVPRPEGGLRISIPVFDNHGATSLFATVEDLARWDRNFSTGQVGGAALIEQLHSRGRLNSGAELEYAFALVMGQYRGLKTVGHSGADAGYRADFLRFPDQGFSVACLCNLGTINPGELARRVADVYLARHFPHPVSASDGDRAPRGSYAPREAELRGRAGSLTPTFADAFLGDAGQVRFVRDAQGRVAEFFLTTGRVRKLRFVRAATP